MRSKRILAVLLSAAMAVSVMTGCFWPDGDHSEVAASVINEMLESDAELNFTTNKELYEALRDAVQEAGGDLELIQDKIVEKLGLTDIFTFSESGVKNAKTGQHTVPVCRVSGSTPEEAARNAFDKIDEILNALPADGKYTPHVSMVQDENGEYILAIDLTVDQAGSSGSGQGSGGQNKPTATVSSIEVTYQQDYVTGDSLAISEVKAIYTDDTSKILSAGDYTVTIKGNNGGAVEGTTFKNADTYTVTVRYEGQKKEFTVNVTINPDDASKWVNGTTLTIPSGTTLAASGPVTGDAIVKAIQDYDPDFDPADIQIMDLSQSGITELSYITGKKWANLTTVTLPETLTTLGEESFNGCENLASINLEDTNLTQIRDFSFAKTNLRLVKLPASIETMGIYTFSCDPSMATAITEVDLSQCSNLKSIGHSSFRETHMTSLDLTGCTSLTKMPVLCFITA